MESDGFMYFMYLYIYVMNQMMESDDFMYFMYLYIYLMNRNLADLFCVFGISFKILSSLGLKFIFKKIK